MTLHLYDGIKLKSKESAKKAGIYAYLIAFFVLGAAVGVFASENLGNYSVLVCAAPSSPSSRSWSRKISKKPNRKPNNGFLFFYMSGILFSAQ